MQALPPSDSRVSLPPEGETALPDAPQNAATFRSERGSPPTDLPPDVHADVPSTRAATTAGHPTAIGPGERTEHGFAALWRGVVKLATKIPWLGTTSAVQTAAKNIRISDAAYRQIDALKASSHASFVQGLKSTYGEETANAVIAVTGLSPKDYLTTAKMHEAHAEAMFRQANPDVIAKKAS